MSKIAHFTILNIALVFYVLVSSKMAITFDYNFAASCARPEISFKDKRDVSGNTIKQVHIAVHLHTFVSRI